MPREPKPPVVIKLLGLEIPLERWALHLVGAIAVVSVAALALAHIIPEWTAVLSPQKVNEQLEEDISEYGLHVMEAPEHEYTLFDDVRGKLAVRAYADGCLLIQRRNQVATVTKLVRDLSRPSTPPKRAGTLLPSLIPTVNAQGRCLNPHSGPFQWKYGARNGCWVEVWRVFSDSCTHVQFLNVCSGAWDSNPDGSAKVRWTRCVH